MEAPNPYFSVAKCRQAYIANTKLTLGLSYTIGKHLSGNETAFAASGPPSFAFVFKYQPAYTSAYGAEVYEENL